DVGTGKTYVLIAAGQELKRMRLSSKNMYVVPNQIIGQWKDLYLQLYPDAKLLIVNSNNFKPERRAKTLKQIRDEDFDAIIITYSCFEEIPISNNKIIEDIKEKIKKIKSKKDNVWYYQKNIERLKSLEKELDKYNKYSQNSGGIFFEDLNINRLFVDEAHNYKNLSVESYNCYCDCYNGSKKCTDMLDKVRIIQNNDGGVIFATGTPITNSITDLYVMQKYLQYGELTLMDIHRFEAWLKMFATTTMEFEVDVDTNNFRLKPRFTEFHNLPQLTAILTTIADFYTLDEIVDVPQFNGYSDVIIEKSEQLKDYLDDISERADKVRGEYFRIRGDNMLKITIDGKKAALDMRLVDSKIGPLNNSKVAKCVENVMKIYYDTMPIKGTQIIFCDMSTPKKEFNLYDEIKQSLIICGINKNEIAYIHDANTERERENLFNKVRNGDVRILLGSTEKLGTGVNVQDKLIAIHHLDVPWRPSDMIQREGRIIRQGNTNSEVYIYRYITKGSFDAYSWQILETKQRIITGLLAGTIVDKTCEDVSDTVLNYAEVKALAIGNMDIKKRVELTNELARLSALQKKSIEERIKIENELVKLPKDINTKAEIIKNAQIDLDAYQEYKRNNQEIGSPEDKKRLKEYINSSLRLHILKPEEKELIEYKGFKIILPSNMVRENLYLYLSRAGKYYVKLDDETEGGTLIRIDNYLDSLSSFLERNTIMYNELLKRQNDLKAALEKNESYTSRIEECKNQIEEIDKKIGVVKKK
nr:DEAD/DEAH box helicase family protein [Clostridia bacterium]